MTAVPGDDRAALARLRALADLRRWPDLETAARQALSTMPDRADVHAHLARALLLQNRPEEAVDAAERGLQVAPGDDWLGRVLTSALVAAGRTDEAAGLLANLLANDPDSYHVRVLAARVALRRLELPEAEDHARAALGADPERAGGYVMLAATLSQAGRPLEAEDVARQGLSVHPNSGDLHCQLAVALERTGRRPEAALHWVEAGRVGRYPEVAVEGLRQLMVDPPMHWLWAVVGTVSFVVCLAIAGAVFADGWTAWVVGVATAAVVTLAVTPVLAPVVRRRRRRRTLEHLPPDARAVIDLAGVDDRG